VDSRKDVPFAVIITTIINNPGQVVHT